MQDDAVLHGLAGAMLDGSSVDWASAEASAVDESMRRMIRNLKVVAAIAEVHGSVSLSSDSQVASAGGAPTWLSLDSDQLHEPRRSRPPPFRLRIILRIDSSTAPREKVHARRLVPAGPPQPSKGIQAWPRQAPACARRSRRTSPRASPTSTRRSTTPSSPSPTARATRCRGRPPARAGFKGSRKSTPFAAQVAAEQAGREAQECGVKNLEVRIKGPGPGRESAVRALNALGFKITSISDVTPVPHNGCRPPKKRRI